MTQEELQTNRFTSLLDNLFNASGKILLSVLAARSWKTKILLLLILLSPLMLTGALIAQVESSPGPVDIGTYSVSGPRTQWVIFPGKATVIAECGGYKLWKRNDPQWNL